MSNAEIILVIPFPHPGHLFPATELCNQLASKNRKVTVFYPSSSSSRSLHPSIQVIGFPLSDSVSFDRPIFHEAIQGLIADFFNGRDSSDFPACVIIDEMIGWVVDHLKEFKVPIVSLFTSSASSSALNHAASKIKITPDQLPPGKTLTVPGLPEEMALTSFNFRPHPHMGPPPPSGRAPMGMKNGGPPRRGLDAMNEAAALLFNTCADLEGPFLDYLAKEIGKPVWGVGPLLPARFKDGEVRSKRESNLSEQEVIDWLDSKLRGSVIYVSFGSLVNPTPEELAELAVGLEESGHPFIWVVQPSARRHDASGRPMEDSSSYSPDAVGPNALIIRGWAPQLSILSHPSTGGFVCHCGWNSTVEGLGSGVPVLTWPVRGDQFQNAELATSLLKVGLPLKKVDVEVRKEDVVRGIEMLMADEGIKKRAASVRSIFDGGLPASSSAAIDAFLDLVKKK